MLLAAGAAALLSLGAVLSSPVTAHAQQYPAHAVDLGDKAGLSLTVPEGYRTIAGMRNMYFARSGDAATKQQLEAVILSLFGPHNPEGLLSSITVSVRPAPEGVTMFTPELEKSLPSIIANSAYDATILKTAHITVAKEPALSIAVKFVAYQEELDKRFEIRDRTILVLHDHKLYTFVFHAPVDHFNNDVKAFEKLIASIVWTAAPVKANTEAEKPAASE